VIRLVTLTAGLFLLVCLFAVSQDLQSLARSIVVPNLNSTAKQYFSEHLKKDPAIGSRNFVRTPLSRTNHLIVLVGNCEECADKMILRIAEVSLSAGVPAFYVSKVNPTGALLTVMDKPISSSVVIDADGSVHERLNGFFTPRVFLIDADGRISWKQDSPELASLANRLKEFHS